MLGYYYQETHLFSSKTDFECIVVNNKCIAETSGSKLCSVISINTHVCLKSIAKIHSNYDE